jgi:hypothetical protein
MNSIITICKRSKVRLKTSHTRLKQAENPAGFMQVLDAIL